MSFPGKNDGKYPMLYFHRYFRKIPCSISSKLNLVPAIKITLLVNILGLFLLPPRCNQLIPGFIKIDPESFFSGIIR